MAKKKGGAKNKTPRGTNPQSSNQTPRGRSNNKKANASKSNLAHDQKMAEIDNMSFLNSPIKSSITLVRVILSLVFSVPGFLISNGIAILTIVASTAVFFYVEGPHAGYRDDAKEFGAFAAWWIGLGVASSVGLGTGLHTFVLYLGPYMAKVTMAANECNSIPVFVPNRWSYESFAPCQKWEGEPTISVLEIYSALSIEALLWGFGTALGELPPYFVARAASIAGKKHEELEQIEGEIQENASLFDKLKGMLYTALKRHAFVVVLLCASIPNPLFDLAGLTCGHFLIPFWTFFSATAIGKAGVKVTIQSFFVIIMFSAHTVNRLLDLVGSFMPDAKEFLYVQLEKQKKKLYEAQSDDEDPPLLAQIWNYVIIAMIAYFLYAFLNAIVQNQLKYDEEVKDNKDK